MTRGGLREQLRCVPRAAAVQHDGVGQGHAGCLRAARVHPQQEGGGSESPSEPANVKNAASSAPRGSPVRICRSAECAHDHAIRFAVDPGSPFWPSRKAKVPRTLGSRGDAPLRKRSQPFRRRRSPENRRRERWCPRCATRTSFSKPVLIQSVRMSRRHPASRRHGKRR